MTFYRNESYEQFVNKFENHKMTKDDCYTPEPIYDVVKSYTMNKFGIDEKRIIRPFYPGGDYQSVDYTGRVVVDNPPFSIMSQIVYYYVKNEIPFFLFAPGSAIESIARRDKNKFTKIVTDTTLTYTNGAKVRTAFVTNLFKDDTELYFDPVFQQKLVEANRKSNSVKKVRVTYKYPEHVLRQWDLFQILRNVDKPFAIKHKDTIFVQALDEQKQQPKPTAIYGGGIFINDKVQKQIAKIKASKDIKPAIKEWHLSQREKNLIKELDEASESDD